MRLLAIVLIPAVLAGCTHWTSVSPKNLDHERATVVTRGSAYELDGAYLDGDNVTGLERRRWQTESCDKAAIEDCEWQEAVATNSDVSIPKSQIEKVTAKRDWIAGELLVAGAALLCLAYPIVVFAVATPNTCEGC